jgi:NADP-dependent 3-hydroxy acid dehydrogenase YdfG
MKTEPPQMAVVTGSSSGIGFKTSLLLARKGVYTYATMRNLSKSEEILNYAKKENLPLETLVLDVIDARSISNAIQKIINERGRIDILVLNVSSSFPILFLTSCKPSSVIFSSSLLFEVTGILCLPE